MKKNFTIGLALVLSFASCENSSEEKAPINNTVGTKEAVHASVQQQTPKLPNEAVLKLVKPFVTMVKNNDIEQLKKLVRYPLKRQNPLKAIANEDDFVKRYNEVFDAELNNAIANGEWSEIGSKGIMLNDGLVWLAPNGDLVAINYNSSAERAQIAQLLAIEKGNIHESLKEFEQPVTILKTQKFVVRIDLLKNQMYRYASWNLGTPMSAKPDLMIENGKVVSEGRGGDCFYEFNNKDYQYIVYMNVLAEDNVPDAHLKVMRAGKEVLKQGGTIIATEDVNALEEKVQSSLPDPSNASYKDALGGYLLGKERFGKLKIGSTFAEVRQLYGQPNVASKPEYSDATGEYIGAIEYPSQGLTLTMNGEPNASQTISGITITKPSQLKTNKNIGIGSTVQQLIKAYQPHLNPNVYNGKKEVVLGTLYGGMIVKFEQGKIIEMSLGVFAE